ncbi:MAG: hypothetical protein KBD01_18955 [Acidobacteria bacterium]|nr:hypothetical protein [Acidobacteriota bacterium]
MTSAPSSRAQQLLAVHSLAWLSVACAIGELMALLLLVPQAGEALGALTYGRWAALHLDIALYGWCALPLVGLLLRFYRVDEGDARAARFAIQAWSGTLLAGALVWLAGSSSGKVFLDWSGFTRWLFVGLLLLLAGVLASGPREARARPGLARVGLLVALLTVPVAMLVATSRGTYPPVNPASGGPTGADLLGSTLLVLAIFLATPAILGLHRPEHRRATLGLGALLAAQVVLFAVVRRGESTHHDPLQIAALATLALWAWPLPRYLARFAWPAGARAWLVAFLGWGGALVASGLGSFLPGVLENVKFTNVLVGHAHIAMAGMASSFGALLLLVLGQGGAAAHALSARVPFVAWHAGTVVHVAAVTAVGALEAADPGVLFRPEPTVTALYLARAIAGLAMFAAAATWLRRAAAGLA